MNRAKVLSIAGVVVIAILAAVGAWANLGLFDRSDNSGVGKFQVNVSTPSVSRVPPSSSTPPPTESREPPGSHDRDD